jgi:endonuclease-3
MLTEGPGGILMAGSKTSRKSSTSRSKSNRKKKAKPDGDSNPASKKVPLDIDVAVRRIRDAVAPYPKAALFELAADGFDSPFEQLVACILSIRTRDEVTLPTARRLFEQARTPAEMARLTAEQIDKLIRTCTFHENKATQIRELADRAVAEHGGSLPCDEQVLLSMRGVGPKCANLVLGIACDQPRIGVDIHVHRVVNRWGYVEATTPEKTMRELHDKLPHDYWVEINSLLVPFGKHICTGRQPKCLTCPVLDMCRQVGVTSHR